jgi:hypothetical protein
MSSAPSTAPKYFDISLRRGETEMKFLDLEVARELEVWPPVPEVVDIPKLKVMSDLYIGTFALSAMRLRGLCPRCETGNGGS